MEENKDLMVQEEENVDLDTSYDYEDTEEKEESSGFGLTGLAIAGLIGAGIALGAKKGYTWLKNRKKSKKIEATEVVDVEAVPVVEEDVETVDEDAEEETK